MSLRINLENLSLEDQKRFREFCRISQKSNTPIREIVRIWNQHAINMRQLVFVYES